MTASLRPSLALLAALALSLGSACGEPRSEVPSDSTGRYQVHAIQTAEGPLLVRFDTATGSLEQAPLAAGRRWQPLGTTPAEPRDGLRPGRYSLDYFQTPSIPLTFVRTDTQSGAVWRLRRPRELDWTAIRSSASTAGAAPDSASEVPGARAPTLAPATVPTPTVSRTPRDVGQQTREDVEAYVEAIAYPNAARDLRAYATEQLGKGPSDAAVPPLLTLLEDEDTLIVRSAARALSRLDDPRVQPALEALAAEHPDPAVKRVAERGLEKLR